MLNHCITLLQIDSLQQIKNNAGFWDNFIWPLAVAIVIGFFGLLWKFLTNKPSKKKSTDTQQTNKIKNNTNSPVIGKIENQTIHNYLVDPNILKRLNTLEEKHEELIKTNKMNNQNEKMNINVTNNGISGITAGIVNISNSTQYFEPNNLLLSQVENNLNLLIGEFPTRPKIIIEIESGNLQRHQTACDLEKIIQKFDLGSYPKGNVHMAKHPNNPITIIGNKQNIKFLEKFVNAISPYLSSKWQYETIDSFPDEFLKIYINGTPTFNNNGSVTIS